MSRVAKGVEFFEKASKKRVIFQGHGLYRTGDPNITVPAGKTIHFYVRHGEVMTTRASWHVEGFTGTGRVPKPLESYGPGSTIPDYRLGYPSGLSLNGTKNQWNYDWIVVRTKGRWIPLSILLQDSRCEAATDLHWAACREVISRTRRDMAFDKTDTEPAAGIDHRAHRLFKY